MANIQLKKKVNLFMAIEYTGRMRPEHGWHTGQVSEPVLVIACGALASEIVELKKVHGWDHVHLVSLDAWLHNRPERIPDRLRHKIRQFRTSYQHIFVAYADCGTGGGIDKVLEEEGIDRLPGAHCYEFFAGRETYKVLANAEPGTFYLTDFLARHFDRFVIQPLQLDAHPELRDSYFGNYQRLVYLSQSTDAELLQAARDAAARLGLEFEHVHCGFGDLESGLTNFVAGTMDG
jgi:hypothetical protein